MVDHTRRRRYQYDRVLIESSRVLTAQFDDAIVYLTGAQLEMLRNVSQYLRNLNSYVSEYQPGYYLTPDVSDYDDILEIVADLEETLMGNPNTIWGYKDVWAQDPSSTNMSAPDHTLYGGTVPAGEVWRLHSVSFETDSATCTSIRVRVNWGIAALWIVEQLAPVANRLYTFPVDIVLSAGDLAYCVFYGVTAGDDGLFGLQGYKMDVP